MFPTKILLAADGSEEARRAARTAKALADRTGSELHLVYVEPMPSVYAYPESVVYDPDLQEEVRAAALRSALEKLEAEAQVVGGLEKATEAHPRIGRPDAEIVRLAEEIQAGLVVVGSRGLSPIRRAVVGSVSLSVVRHAHGPVLVVRGDGRAEESRIGPIVLAVDGSRESRLAAGAAAEISAATGSTVHLIYVMPVEARLYGRHFYSQEVRKSLLEEAKAGARKYLEEQAEDVRSGGGDVTQTYLGTGRPDEEIVELAEEIDAGMVVLGSRGLGGVRRALVGSVSDSVMRHAHCPVLILREDAQRSDGAHREG